MMLQGVRVSIGRTWGLVRPTGEADVAWDSLGYRQRIEELQRADAENGFRLPWPAYPSTFWRYMSGGRWYRDLGAGTLSDVMVPLLLERERAEPGWPRPLAVEVVLHPFAVTTMLHVELGAVEPWPEDSAASTLLHELMRRPLANGRQVRDGVGLSEVEGLPTAAFGDRPASYSEAGEFVLLSGLHQEAPKPVSLAYRLASLFEKTADDKGRPMNTDLSAISVTSRRVALVLPRAQARAGARVGCLHHNMATLLAYLQNLLTLLPASATQSCGPFQRRAAVVVNCLYRRAALPTTGSIYKSQLAELWTNHLERAAAVDAINAEAAAELPPLE